MKNNDLSTGSSRSSERTDIVVIETVIELIVRMKTNECARVMFLFCVWDDITSVIVSETSKSKILYLVI